jgi:hypothetical protein
MLEMLTRIMRVPGKQVKNSPTRRFYPFPVSITFRSCWRPI